MQLPRANQATKSSCSGPTGLNSLSYIISVSWTPSITMIGWSYVDHGHELRSFQHVSVFTMCFNYVNQKCWCPSNNSLYIGNMADSVSRRITSTRCWQIQTARYRFNGCLRNMRIDGKMPTIQPHYYAVSQCHYAWSHSTTFQCRSPEGTTRSSASDPRMMADLQRSSEWHWGGGRMDVKVILLGQCWLFVKCTK